MKKSLAKKITLGILTGAVLMSSSVVWAGDLTDGEGKVLWEEKGSFYYRNKTNNLVGTVPDGNYSKGFYGAHDSGSSDVTGGKVIISAGTFRGGVYGGYSVAGIASGNIVTISGEGTEVYAGVYGGSSNGSGTIDNTVTINGGTISGGVYGGYSLKIGAKAEYNDVIINGGKIGGSNTKKVEVRGGWADEEGNVNNNEVTIKGGSTVEYANVYGGYSHGGDVISNEVTIEGNSTVENTNIYGGYSEAGANTFKWNATKNTVTISGGTFTNTVVQGGSASGGGNATENIVNISGGTFTGEIYGGKIVNGGSVGSYKATSNTVNISGNAVLENAKLYGGYIMDNPYYGGAGTNANTLNIGIDEALKNTLDPDGKYGLQVGAWNNKKVKSIQGFDVINFYNLEWNNGNTIVETEEAHLSPNGTKINVHVASGDMNLNESMTLIKSVSDITGKVHDDSEQPFEIFEGVDKVYEGQISQPDNKSIIVKIVGEDEVPGDGGGTGGGAGDGTGDGAGDGTGDGTGGGAGGNTGDNTGGDNTGGDNTGGDNTGGDNTGGDNTGGDNTGEGTLQPERNDQVLVLGESRAAAVAFTNQGSELIELGLNALARDNSKDTKVFAAVYGNHSEYETGSHVNVNGWSGIVGIGKTNANGLTVGAFFENGEGNYSTHNIFTADYIRGDGEACYNGGGLLVRKDNANGVYAEASLRAGNLQNELRNAVRNGQDLTGYDVDTFYYGAHIGIGKVIPRGADGDSLDVYGKFIYTHHDGETFDVGGTPTKFDSVESERLRVGFRLNEVQTNKLSMYYGAAWEYEFNGDAHDKIASFDLETPSLEGSTVIGEVGMHYKASEKWSLDLNARAYTGQREGFSGSVQANYSF